MMDNFKLTSKEIRLLKDFFLSDYNPQLNKKAFLLLKEKLGSFDPFENEERPEEFSAVIPLFRYIGRKIEQFASGVLVTISEKVYLITAAHVIENSTNIYLPIGDTIEEIVGNMRYENKSADGISVDVAYIKLDIPLSVFFNSRMKLLTIEDLDLNYSPDQDSLCVFTGYPHRKSNYSHESKTVSSNLFEYLGIYSIDKRIYEENDCKFDLNIIMRYNLKDTTTRSGSNLHQAVTPDGISGGGIFTSNIRIKNSSLHENRVKLIGISNSYNKKSFAMFGTKIKYYLEFIAQFDSDVNRIIFPNL